MVNETVALERNWNGVLWPKAVLHQVAREYEDKGATEGWIAQLVCALLSAQGGTTVLETGSYIGTTSAWLAMTLERMGGGMLDLCELEPERAKTVQERIAGLDLKKTDARVYQGDVLQWIKTQPIASLDFVFIDDTHTHEHVTKEIEALWPKMRANGLLCFHDVYGVTQLHEVVRRFGGYSLDLPMLGPAGGLGVIQVR